jgi:hypothetical protein
MVGPGAVRWQAPEVLREEENMSGKTLPRDIYALACLAYEVRLPSYLWITSIPHKHYCRFSRGNCHSMELVIVLFLWKFQEETGLCAPNPMMLLDSTTRCGTSSTVVGDKTLWTV